VISHDLDIFQEFAGFVLHDIKTLEIILSRANKRRHASSFPAPAKEKRLELSQGSGVVLKAGMPESGMPESGMPESGMPECRNTGMPEIETRKS